MSVHFDASRQQYAVRWRQDGRNWIRRLQTKAEALSAVSGVWRGDGRREAVMMYALSEHQADGD